MPKYIYLNGEYAPYHQASIHAEDRGFLFGDAVYEVIAHLNGTFADERAHMDRLERSVEEIGMRMPVTREVLNLLMRELLRKNRIQDSAVYIQISRGSAKRDFKFPDPNTIPTLMIMTPSFAFNADAPVQASIKVCTVDDVRWKRRDIKTVLLLPQSMAKQTAVNKGCDDAWMVDDAGFITEGSASNAYIVKDKTVITRPVSTDILKGTTRNALEYLCKQKGYAFEERQFKPEEAYEADEAFVTGATTLVTSVYEIDGHKIGTEKYGPIAEGLFGEYCAYVNGKYTENGESQLPWESGL